MRNSTDSAEPGPVDGEQRLATYSFETRLKYQKYSEYSRNALYRRLYYSVLTRRGGSCARALFNDTPPSVGGKTKYARRDSGRTFVSADDRAVKIID